MSARTAVPATRSEWVEAWRTRRHGALTVAEQAVILTAALYADDSGENVRPSQTTLAETVGITREATNRALRTAVGLGWLVLDQRGGGGRGRVNRYRLAVPVSDLAALRQEVAAAARTSAARLDV